MLFQLFDCEEQALFLRAPGLGVEYKIHIAGSEIRDMMNRPGQNVLGIVIVARTEERIVPTPNSLPSFSIFRSDGNPSLI